MTLPSLGEQLTRLRSDMGLSQRQLAEKLCAMGVQVSNQAVSKWENGSTQPNARQFLALLRIFNVSDPLSVFTGAPAADPLAGLNRQGRAKVDAYIQDLLATGRYNARPAAVPAPAPVRRLPLYRLAASAGTGQLLDGGEYDEIEVDSAVPASADFGVRLAGDSMEPRLHDGQIVWVHRQNTLRPGQIGIFLYDGSAWCKRLEQGPNGPRLCSFNPAYAPIEPRPGEDLSVFGRVVGA